MLGREPLEQAVRGLGEPDLERAEAAVGANAVEDDDATRAAQGDVARETVDQLLTVAKAPGVEEVVAVEEVDGRVRQVRPPPCVAASRPRTGRRRLPR